MTEPKHFDSSKPRPMSTAAERLERKTLRDQEGRVAMADYERDQQATLDRTAKLKALRLARDAAPIEAKPVKRRKKAN
jgi:hypothetical protein